MHVAVDGTIQHTDSQKDEEKDNERKKDVSLGVERKQGGASIQAAHTVPAQQGQEANNQRQTPTKRHQAIDSIVGLSGRLLGKWLHHGGVTLHSNQQQTEYGGCQGHEQHALPEEPQSRRQAKGPAARQADVHQVSGSGEEIAERDVGNANIDPTTAAADARDDGHQNQEILQDDENAEEQEDGHGDADLGLGVRDGPVLQTAGVVVMPQDHVVDPSRSAGGIRCGAVALVGGYVVHVRAGGRGREGGQGTHDGKTEPAGRMKDLGENRLS